MPSQNIDRGVKGGKGRLSGNVRKTSVVGDKVNHLLLHVLSVIFHPFSSLAESSGGDHVVANLRRVLFIIERESPVRREFIWGKLIRNNNFSGRGKGSHGYNRCDSGTSRCLDKRPASRWMILMREKEQRESFCEASNLRKKVDEEVEKTEESRNMSHRGKRCGGTQQQSGKHNSLELHWICFFELIVWRSMKRVNTRPRSVPPVALVWIPFPDSTDDVLARGDAVMRVPTRTDMYLVQTTVSTVHEAR